MVTQCMRCLYNYGVNSVINIQTLGYIDLCEYHVLHIICLINRARKGTSFVSSPLDCP